MKEIGYTVELEALKTTPQGVYLITDEQNEILLPNKYVPRTLQMGDKIEVFVYTDSEDRPIATTLVPKVKINQVALLSCVDVNDFGAFFDWGVEKHLLVPFAEQFVKVFEGTIKENILFSKPNASDNEIMEAVKMAYVNEFTDRFEQGLDTVIGERGVKLSGGQRQRVAIARAILANPKLLILDEATSSLDSESELLVQKSLTELMKGRTTFVIAHRLSTIKMAHQILVVEGGKIVEKGTHDDLIKAEGRYFNLFTYQSRI